jgi:1-aminocyclopropane-1-carboxylate deaminase/D-cysteine desulfhydrase-like pyridoxal-dependent ACC family enzyme
MSQQAKEAGVKIGHIYVASGSAGTQAGCHVGARIYLPGCKVHGVAVSRSSAEQTPKVADLARKLVTYIGEDFTISDNEIIVHDDYIGTGYAIPTEDGLRHL